MRALTLREWRLLMVAVFILPVVALSLRFTGINRTKNFLSKFIPDHTRDNDQNIQDQGLAQTITHMVSVAARYVPLKANCLRQSLVIWWLLARHGLESEIRFGVKTNPAEEFAAHAWVECDGVNLSDSDALQKLVVPLKGSARGRGSGAGTF